MIPKIKICCISSEQEAQMAIKAGASALGLVAKMPSGPGTIDDDLILKIAKTVPPPIATFMLTSETSSEKIIEHHHKTLTNTIQIVDELSEGTYEGIRAAIPSVKLVQVVHVTDESSVDYALRIADKVDAILLDSGNPLAKVKELGGTGRTHNWKLSKQIVTQLDIPVFLAGGIHAHNVIQAIEEVEPFGIDLCNGVRTEGKLDPGKLDLFFKTLSALQ